MWNASHINICNHEINVPFQSSSQGLCTWAHDVPVVGTNQPKSAQQVMFGASIM